VAEPHLEQVISVHHWTDELFSFKTTRDPLVQFSNGHFVMIGMMLGEKKVMRAYSIASPNSADHLEFLSIVVPNGPLTSNLRNIVPGDKLIVGRKPTGTLVVDYLKPGKNLYLLATGTGLAPFLAIIRDPLTYERFENIVLVHGVREVAELAYHDLLCEDLNTTGDFAVIRCDRFKYYPTVTRQDFRNTGRITDRIKDGKLFTDLGLPVLNSLDDRVMICGSPSMLSELRIMLDHQGFSEGNTTQAGEYVIEKAFAGE